MPIILIVAILYLIIPKSLLAINEFTLQQKIHYSVEHQGDAKVKQEIILTNNYSQIYAKEYQINLPGTYITNIIGNDRHGNIVDKIEKRNDTTIVSLNFKNPAVGKDQVNQFSLEYYVPNFAIKKGNTWELQFPSFINNTSRDNISITLEVPTSFGELSFSSVPITDTHVLGKINQIRIHNNQIVNNKLLLVFGNHQLFNFQLLYFLKNSKDTNVSTEIPIPPDTNSQTVIIDNIDPLPIKINTDSDGNWLAQYEIPAQQSIKINLSGQAKIHPPIYSEKKIDIEALTAPQKYWPTTHLQITNIANNLKTSKEIYRYVIDNLSYNYTGIDSATRQGALFAIENPTQSVCTEFTDLFVTLARAKKIPSREIEGFAYSNSPKIKPVNADSDILHAWPEYFDEKKKDWIQIDPTWEKTTNGIDYFNDLDLNHLVFVIHGKNSEYPPPPGSYKDENQTKTVSVDFATTELKPIYKKPLLSITKNKISIDNPNMFSIHSIEFKILNLNKTYKIETIPPLGASIIDIPNFSFISSILPQNSKYKITLITRESDNSVTYQLTNKLHYLNLSIAIGICIIILCIGGIIVTTSLKKNEKNS